MKPLDLDLDAQAWYERWEAMQNAYIPQRRYRFDLMFDLAELPRDRTVQIIDLGCGPGSLAFHALRYYPNARVLAVDGDAVLLAIGQRVAEKTSDRIEFVRADFRQPQWWAPHEQTADLIVSATTLHWLSRADLTATYRAIFRALKPGCSFMSSDHFAADDPGLQTIYRQRLEHRQRIAFSRTGADDWEGYWKSMAACLGLPDMKLLRGQQDLWDGTEDGQPRRFHVDVLGRCGFAPIAFVWQDLGEAVLMARRPKTA